MAITKKALGNQGNYCNELKKWTEHSLPSYKSAMDEAMEENRRLAYNRLLNALHNKKATMVDLIHAMRDAARYLEHTLED
jgi:ribosomal protein L44E